MKSGKKIGFPSHNKIISSAKQLTHDLDLFMHEVAVSFNKPCCIFQSVEMFNYKQISVSVTK